MLTLTRLVQLGFKGASVLKDQTRTVSGLIEGLPAQWLVGRKEHYIWSLLVGDILQIHLLQKHTVILTTSLIVCWECSCLQGDLYTAHSCYQHPACALTDCISFFLTARRPPAHGGDTANCRSCVFWRSVRGDNPLLILLGRVKRDSSLPGPLPPFIREFPLIGEPVGCEYQHDEHTAEWGYEIIGCILWLPDTFSIFSTQVFWLFCC